MRGLIGKVAIALVIIVLAFFLSAQLPTRPLPPAAPTPSGRVAPAHPRVDESPSSPDEAPLPAITP